MVVSGSDVGIPIGNPVNLSEDKLSSKNIKVELESPTSTTIEDNSDVGQPANIKKYTMNHLTKGALLVHYPK
jgi:hypothetical protein